MLLFWLALGITVAVIVFALVLVAIEWYETEHWMEFISHDELVKRGYVD